MAIGGKARFTTKQVLGVLSLVEQGNRRGEGVVPIFLDSSYYTLHSGEDIRSSVVAVFGRIITPGQMLCVCLLPSCCSVACALAVKCNELTRTLRARCQVA